MTPTSEERKSIVVPKEYQDELDRQAKARARGFEADYLDGAHGLYVLLAHNNALKNEKSEPYATLTEQNAKLKATLGKLYGYIENKTLVRNTEGDSASSWAITMLEFVKTLQEAQSLLEESKPLNS